ncbi:hypothetical protein JCM33374_g3423 [Metschnikowia sp. JCM 33374]|nr:hypothetical protein JCM33374_g3423 [Metschnikowia sp. JCM 33374]
MTKLIPENLSEQEDAILLAIEEKKRNPTLSVRDLARRFQVARSTLQARVNGRQSKLQSCQNKQLMTPIEEDSLKKWILYLNCIGLPPQHPAVRKMANAILAARATIPPLTIGNNWLSRYLNRTTGLTSKIARPRDYIRTYCETPEKFNDWFNRVENTIMEFGIEKQDVYNVDETGFAMEFYQLLKL